MTVHKTTFSKLGKKSATDLARKLIEEGNDPSDTIEIYRDGRMDLKVTNIGIASKLKIVDNGRGNIRHGIYTPIDRLQNAV